MNFREWLQLEETGILSEAPSSNPFNSGTMRSRPGRPIVANRSQMWGPSATYGRADALMPWDKVFPAMATSVGDSIMQSLGQQPTAVTRFEPFPESDKTLDRWGVLPLQLPPDDFNMGRRNKLGMLQAIQALLGEGPQAKEDPRINKGAVGTEKGQVPVGSDSNAPKFTLVTQAMMGDVEVVERSVEFTEALMHYVHVINMAEENIVHQYDWKDPEIHPNITNDDPPLYEAIFRFDPVTKNQWGTAKSFQSQKQRELQDKYTQQDIASALDATNMPQAGGQAPNPQA